MFNVCVKCGNYSDDKIIIDSNLAQCKSCLDAYEFVSLPLFVVTGASGAGKTTAALQLSKQTQEFIVLDQDILWNDCYNDPSNNFQLFRNTWLRMIKNINQAGRPVILFGSSVPEQFEACNERRYIAAVYYLALVCEPAKVEERLKARPGWRGSGDDDNVRRMLEFNQWFLDNADKTKPEITLLDTSNCSVEQTSKQILQWAKSQQYLSNRSGQNPSSI